MCSAIVATSAGRRRASQARQRLALGSPAVMAFCTRSMRRPLSLRSTAARLFDVMKVGARGHDAGAPRRATATVSMPATSFFSASADGNRYTCSTDVPSAYVVPRTLNNPLGAAPLLIGTKPASVSRFSMLHCRQAPSETHDGAPLACGVGDGAAVAGAESLRSVATALGAVRAESPRAASERPHPSTNNGTAHHVPRAELDRLCARGSAVTRTPTRIQRWRRARSAESARRRMNRHCARSDSRLPCGHSAT